MSEQTGSTMTTADPASADDAAAQQALAELREQNARLVEQMAAIERRQRIDQLLIEADAVDLEAARLLTEHAVAQMDDADVAEAVADLRRHKPYLFRRVSEGVGSMSPRIRDGGAVDEAADAAMRSGDRRDLLRYLRMRRRNRA